MNKFDLKDRLDSQIYRIYNFLSEIHFFFNPKIKNIIAENLALKNAHAGERCFILGTGPSLAQLTQEQIGALASEKTFALNSFYKSAIGKQIAPSFYAAIDNNYWELESYKKDIKNIVDIYKEDPPIFITDQRAKAFFDGFQGIPQPIYLHAKKYPVKDLSFDLHKNTYGLMNVASFCIAAAIHLGFKEIYLLGCDYNAFCTQGHGHCYNDTEEMSAANYDLAFYLKYYHLTTTFHYLLAASAKKSGVKIVNLTPNSLLDAYPRANINTVIK